MYYTGISEKCKDFSKNNFFEFIGGSDAQKSPLRKEREKRVTLRDGSSFHSKTIFPNLSGLWKEP